MAHLVDRGSLEMCGMYWVFSLCGRICKRRRGSAHGGRRVREQPWMRHGSHQMTTLVLANKDDTAILEPSALVVRCALVNKLYYRNVACEWVSCLHSPSIFWNSFQETEISTIYQMMWNTMSSNLFAIMKLSTAKLKMKMLPAGFPVALWGTTIQFSDRHSNRSFLLLRIVDLVDDCWCSGCTGLRDCCVSDKWAPCILRHCFNSAANSGSPLRRLLRPISIQTKNPTFGVLQPLCSRSCIVVSFKSDAIEKHDFLLTNIVLRQWLSVFFFVIQPWKYRWTAAMFALSCFLEHLLRLEEHHLSFRCAMLWSLPGILLNDKARDWSRIAIGLQGCCRTPLVLHSNFSRNCNKWSRFLKSIGIKTLMFCGILAKFENLCVVHVDEYFLWFLTEPVDLPLLTHVLKELFLMLMFLEHLDQLRDVVLSPCILHNWDRYTRYSVVSSVIAVGLDFATIFSSSFCSCTLVRHLLGTAGQAGILNAANRAKMDDVEQMKKIVPFVTCTMTFGQNVCELMFGVDVPHLNLGVQIDPIKQPIKSNSVGSWSMPPRGTSASDNHFNFRLIVLKCLLEWRWCAWIGRVCAYLALWPATGLPETLPWLVQSCSARNETLQSPNPREWEREYRPCVNLHREKWFQLL